MKRLLVLLLAGMATPALAQRAGHGAEPAPASAPSCTPEHVAMGHCELPPQPQEPSSRPAEQLPAREQPATDPHAGHAAPQEPPPDPHAGRTMPGQPQQMPEMPGHDMGAMAPEPGSEAVGTNLPAGTAPAPPVPVANAADAFYGREAMDHAREHLREFHGGQEFFQIFANELEYQTRSGRDGFAWDVDAWYGGDIDRFWLKSEGEGEWGGPLETLETQALYSHAIGPYFNLQGGIRYDIRPKPNRVYATAGVEGLAPSFFELEAFAFLSNKGELMGRLAGYYDQRVTQRLILQPTAELNFAAQNSREIGVGAGLSDAEIGLRLRYDIRREFAPYIGVQYERAFGRTRRYLRDEGEDPDVWSILTGVRLWF